MGSNQWRNEAPAPDWAIRPWREPHIIARYPQECLCTWVWAPDITGTKDFPFIIKFPSRLCDEHRKDYFPHVNDIRR